MLSGLKTRFLAELLEVYGEAVGPGESHRLINRLSTKQQRWFAGGARAQDRPELLPLEDVEESLIALEDSATTQGNRYEAAVAEVVARTIARRTWVLGEPSTRAALGRLVPLIEELWPFRPPTIAVEDTASGLRITMTLLGYSRCTRLLTYQLLGALNSAYRVSSSARHEELHTTVDFFGDRARIDVAIRRTDETLPRLDSEPLARRPSARVRLLRPSLAAEVESILGHRTTSQPPPPNAPPQAPVTRPPTSAIGMAQLRRPSQTEQEAVRPSVAAQACATESNRPPSNATRRSTPPPRSTRPSIPPEASALKHNRPSDRPSAAHLRASDGRSDAPPSSSPSSRRDGQSR